MFGPISKKVPATCSSSTALTISPPESSWNATNYGSSITMTVFAPTVETSIAKQVVFILNVFSNFVMTFISL